MTGTSSVHQIDEQALAEDGRADHRYLREQRVWGSPGSPSTRGEVPPDPKTTTIREARAAESEQVDGGAGDDLVRLERYAHDARG